MWGRRSLPFAIQTRNFAATQPLPSGPLRGAHPAPSASPTRFGVGGWGGAKGGGDLSAQRTYSHSAVSAGTAAPRGASCGGLGARPGRAPRGFPRWPGSPAPRPQRRTRIRPLAALLWPPRDGRPAPLVLPRQRPLQPPRADTGAKVNSPPSIPPGRRCHLPPQVSFLLQSVPVIHRARSAPRSSDPYRVRGAAPGPCGPAPARPGPGVEGRG